jgi:hypothetical protein
MEVSMKKCIVLILLVFAITLALNPNLTKKETILIDEPLPQTTNKIVTNPLVTNNPPLDNMPLVGRVECIGGTCYDWVNGPDATWLVDDPANGIHATWMWSNAVAMDDRNMRYNFYEWATHTWSWLSGTSYMQYGIPVFPHIMTSVAGGADLDPITKNFVIAGNYAPSGVIGPEIARDQAPGAGLFEYTMGTTGQRWPFIAVSNNQAIHCATLDVATTESLYYSRIQPWPTWTSYIKIPPPAPDPTFPNDNIAASKTSNKVVIVWEEATPVGLQDRGYYRLSNDGGVTWGAPTQIPFPPVQGFTPSFGVSSLFATFDNLDNLRIVFSVSETGRTIPCEIWHYCPSAAQPMNLVHHYDADTLNAAVGYNAIFATRPTITRNSATGYWYVAWEQFDSLNFEPLTNLARAEIMVAESRDNGLTWPIKTRITSENTLSKRFPIVGGVQVTPSTTDKDTLLVMYMGDSIAGAFLQTQHRFCVNPMFVHRVPVPLDVAIEENPSPKVFYFTLDAFPNPFNSHTTIHYSLPSNNDINLTIYDVSGRVVNTLVSGFNAPGEYSINWDGRTSSGEKVKAGVYFYTLKSTEKTITKKLIITK